MSNVESAYKDISSSTEHGKIIEGFIGFFDILGFSSFVQNNELNYVGDRITELFRDLKSQSISLQEKDPYQLLDWRMVDSKIFSDTIILYQNEKKITNGDDYQWYKSFLMISAVLLRLSFEAGIPLRGAISYGEYFVGEQLIIGIPIIEAYKEHEGYDWTGAVLCPSAVDVLESQQRIHPFDRDIVVPYYAPNKDGIAYERQVIRWDDILIDSRSPIIESIPPLNSINKRALRKRIQEKMYSHNKQPTNPGVKKSVNKIIRNTLNFIQTYPPFFC